MFCISHQSRYFSWQDLARGASVLLPHPFKHLTLRDEVSSHPSGFLEEYKDLSLPMSGYYCPPYCMNLFPFPKMDPSPKVKLGRKSSSDLSLLLSVSQRKTCFPETQEKVRHLKRKNAELAVIAKRLEERARKLQEANLRVVSEPSLGLCKRALAHQRATDLQEQANALLMKDKQINALQRECQELQAKIMDGKEGPPCLPLLDFQHLLRESQKEVLRLQRQIALKNFKAAVEPCGQGSGDFSVAFAMDLGLITSDRTICSNGFSPTRVSQPWEELCIKRKQCEHLEHEVKKKHKRCVELRERAPPPPVNQLLLLLQVESENADLRLQVSVVTEERDSALQKTQELQDRLESLGQALKHMRDVAERRQQLEHQHEKALQALQKKKDEVRQLQQAQAEARKKHEGAVQLLEARVRELENQCRSHTEQFNFLSQELNRFHLQTGKLGLPSTSSFCSSLVTSEIVFATCQSSPQPPNGFRQKGDIASAAATQHSSVPHKAAALQIQRIKVSKGAQASGWAQQQSIGENRFGLHCSSLLGRTGPNRQNTITDLKLQQLQKPVKRWLLTIFHINCDDL
uniref:RIMB1/RIM3A-C-like N-terminal domain-containing protein n=1 Tax=Laticauda laticaudata TaxID=8630 RepID=A0A8C5RLR5_LATLA